MPKESELSCAERGAYISEFYPFQSFKADLEEVERTLILKEFKDMMEDLEEEAAEIRSWDFYSRKFEEVIPKEAL